MIEIVVVIILSLLFIIAYSSIGMWLMIHVYSKVFDIIFFAENQRTPWASRWSSYNQEYIHVEVNADETIAVKFSAIFWPLIAIFLIVAGTIKFIFTGPFRYFTRVPDTEKM